MRKFELNGTYSDLIVDKIQEAADTFKNNTMFCHFFWLKDEDGYLHHMQICNEFISQNFVKEGDPVTVKIKSYHGQKNSYTMYWIRPTESQDVTTSDIKHFDRGNAERPKNPVVHGSAAALALVEANRFEIERSRIPMSGDVEVKDVLSTAEIFLKFLKDNS